jgi:hypothetical protein
MILGAGGLAAPSHAWESREADALLYDHLNAFYRVEIGRAWFR